MSTDTFFDKFMRFSKDMSKGDMLIDNDRLYNEHNDFYGPYDQYEPYDPYDNSFEHSFVMEVIKSNKLISITWAVNSLYESIPADVRDLHIIKIKEWQDSLLRQLILCVELRIYEHKLDRLIRNGFYNSILGMEKNMLNKLLFKEEASFNREITKYNNGQNKFW